MLKTTETLSHAMRLLAPCILLPFFCSLALQLFNLQRSSSSALFPSLLWRFGGWKGWQLGSPAQSYIPSDVLVAREDGGHRKGRGKRGTEFDIVARFADRLLVGDNCRKQMRQLVLV